MSRLDRSGDDVREERLEDEVIVAIEQQDLDRVLARRAAVPRKPTLTA